MKEDAELQCMIRRGEAIRGRMRRMPDEGRSVACMMRGGEAIRGRMLRMNDEERRCDGYNVERRSEKGGEAENA